jgi:asparaginyl-tRNA synthetase
VTQESSIIVTGVPREHPKRPGVYEIDIKSLEIVQLTQDYPISPKEHGVEFLMDHRHLWLRSRRQHAILKVRHEIIRAVRDFFDNQGFVLC